MSDFLTARQRHILSNLERVVPRPYRLKTKGPCPRYQLDGVDCTQQINSLVVRRRVIEISEGVLQRCAEDALAEPLVQPTPPPPQLPKSIALEEQRAEPILVTPPNAFSHAVNEMMAALIAPVKSNRHILAKADRSQERSPSVGQVKSVVGSKQGRGFAHHKIDAK